MNGFFGGSFFFSGACATVDPVGVAEVTEALDGDDVYTLVVVLADAGVVVCAEAIPTVAVTHSTNATPSDMSNRFKVKLLKCA